MGIHRFSLKRRKSLKLKKSKRRKSLKLKRSILKKSILKKSKRRKSSNLKKSKRRKSLNLKKSSLKKSSLKKSSLKKSNRRNSLKRRKAYTGGVGKALIGLGKGQSKTYEDQSYNDIVFKEEGSAADAWYTLQADDIGMTQVTYQQLIEEVMPEYAGTVSENITKDRGGYILGIQSTKPLVINGAETPPSDNVYRLLIVTPELKHNRVIIFGLSDLYAEHKVTSDRYLSPWPEKLDWNKIAVSGMGGLWNNSIAVRMAHIMGTFYAKFSALSENDANPTSKSTVVEFLNSIDHWNRTQATKTIIVKYPTDAEAMPGIGQDYGERIQGVPSEAEKQRLRTASKERRQLLKEEKRGQVGSVSPSLGPSPAFTASSDSALPSQPVSDLSPAQPRAPPAQPVSDLSRSAAQPVRRDLSPAQPRAPPSQPVRRELSRSDAPPVRRAPRSDAPPVRGAPPRSDAQPVRRAPRPDAPPVRGDQAAQYVQNAYSPDLEWYSQGRADHGDLVDTKIPAKDSTGVKGATGVDWTANISSDPNDIEPPQFNDSFAALVRDTTVQDDIADAEIAHKLGYYSAAKRGGGPAKHVETDPLPGMRVIATTTVSEQVEGRRVDRQVGILGTVAHMMDNGSVDVLVDDPRSGTPYHQEYDLAYIQRVMGPFGDDKAFAVGLYVTILDNSSYDGAVGQIEDHTQDGEQWTIRFRDEYGVRDDAYVFGPESIKREPKQPGDWVRFNRAVMVTLPNAARPGRVPARSIGRVASINLGEDPDRNLGARVVDVGGLLGDPKIISAVAVPEEDIEPVTDLLPGMKVTTKAYKKLDRGSHQIETDIGTEGIIESIRGSGDRNVRFVEGDALQHHYNVDYDPRELEMTNENAAESQEESGDNIFTDEERRFSEVLAAGFFNSTDTADHDTEAPKWLVAKRKTIPTDLTDYNQEVSFDTWRFARAGLWSRRPRPGNDELDEVRTIERYHVIQPRGLALVTREREIRSGMNRGEKEDWSRVAELYAGKVNDTYNYYDLMGIDTFSEIDLVRLMLGPSNAVRRRGGVFGGIARPRMWEGVKKRFNGVQWEEPVRKIREILEKTWSAGFDIEKDVAIKIVLSTPISVLEKGGLEEPLLRFHKDAQWLFPLEVEEEEDRVSKLVRGAYVFWTLHNAGVSNTLHARGRGTDVSTDTIGRIEGQGGSSDKLSVRFRPGASLSTVQDVPSNDLTLVWGRPGELITITKHEIEEFEGEYLKGPRWMPEVVHEFIPDAASGGAAIGKILDFGVEGQTETKGNTRIVRWDHFIEPLEVPIDLLRYPTITELADRDESKKRNVIYLQQNEAVIREEEEYDAATKQKENAAKAKAKAAETIGALHHRQLQTYASARKAEQERVRRLQSNELVTVKGHEDAGIGIIGDQIDIKNIHQQDQKAPTDHDNEIYVRFPGGDFPKIEKQLSLLDIVSLENLMDGDHITKIKVHPNVIFEVDEAREQQAKIVDDHKRKFEAGYNISLQDILAITKARKLKYASYANSTGQYIENEQLNWNGGELDRWEGRRPDLEAAAVKRGHEIVQGTPRESSQTQWERSYDYWDKD